MFELLVYFKDKAKQNETRANGLDMDYGKSQT